MRPAGLGALFFAVVLSACGGGNPADGTDVKNAAEPTGSMPVLSLRPVLRMDFGKKCPAAVPLEDGKSAYLRGPAGACFELGPTGVDLARYEVTVLPSDATTDTASFEVEILDRDAVEASSELAASCYQRAPACREGRLGIVHDGALLSAPALVSASFGSEFRVTGFTDQIETFLQQLDQ